MQSEKTNSPDPNRIAKVAEILGLMEESQKNKEWIFQHLKSKKIKNPAKRTMNSYQILNILSDKALEELHKTLTARDVDEFADINSLTKTYHWFFTDIVAALGRYDGPASGPAAAEYHAAELEAAWDYWSDDAG